jgi:hypothetical protein
LSKSFATKITEFFKPQAPLWGCELTSKHVIAAGVNSNRRRVADKLVVDAPTAGNIEALRPVVRQLLSEVGFKGSEIAVVVPDETARIAFVTAENPSKHPEEQRTFIRWKLKKSLPFDVDTAQVAYRVIGPHRSGTGVDILVAVSPKSLVEEYEALFESLDIQAGIVLPSTLAALNLFVAPPGDCLVVKMAPDCITTTIFQNRRAQFYRRVTDVSLYDAVYPTILYYQDKLGGQTLNALYAYGYDGDLQTAFDEIRDKLGLTAQRIEPKSIDDIYKPALGAIHLKSDMVQN